MFRITHFMQEIARPTPVGPRRDPPGPVVIWNLIRRCNLACQHCYTNSTDRDFVGELTTAEVFRVMDDLRAFRVPVLILSGGEPLLRPDIFEIARKSKSMGFYTGLSSNGTRIDEERIDELAAVGFDYVGVSLDGIGATHDAFRRKKGAFDEALRGVRLCSERGIKVGLRFTLTEDNQASLREVVGLLDQYDLDKFYLSHLNYSGRGNTHRNGDAHFERTREVMDFLFEEAWRGVEAGRPREFVTGNNDADGAYLLHWVRRRFPDRAAHIQAKLEQWGGNSTGVNIANIDNLGNVHPDSFWWDYTLGNVRERKFGEIWSDIADPLMAGLKARPRLIQGRCGACAHFAICGGNTRVRAHQVLGDFWGEDPGCYLTDAEIGVKPAPSPTVIEALQAVGTGKKGSEACAPEVVTRLVSELRAETVSPESRAAFFAALFLKGVTPQETPLAETLPNGAIENPALLAQALAPDADPDTIGVCARLLQGSILSETEAHSLGRYLFRMNDGSDSARALVASVLRMRHTEAPEYAGILRAMEETVEPSFGAAAHPTRDRVTPIAQLADPFDGMDRSWSTTPLLAALLQKNGYAAVTMVGRAAGPKWGMTPFDVTAALGIPRWMGTREPTPTGVFGCRVHQRDLSRAVDRWIEIRRQTVKRPFLSTLEKFLSPWKADLLIASAFHHGFSDKMVETAALAGFPSSIILFKGLEGSLGLSLARTSVVVATRTSKVARDGGDNGRETESHTFELRPADFGMESRPDEKRPPTARENSRLIRLFHEKGSSGDTHFDLRATYEAAVYQRVLDWVRGRDCSRY